MRLFTGGWPPIACKVHAKIRRHLVHTNALKKTWPVLHTNALTNALIGIGHQRSQKNLAPYAHQCAQKSRGVPTSSECVGECRGCLHLLSAEGAYIFCVHWCCRHPLHTNALRRCRHPLHTNARRRYRHPLHSEDVGILCTLRRTQKM